FADGFPAIVKRPGLATFASGLSAPPAAISNVPLPDPDASMQVRGIVVVQDLANGRTGVQSSNGTSWSSVTVPAPGLWTSDGFMPLPLYRGRVHYPGSTLGQIYAYDGSTATHVATLASTVTLGDGNLWTLGSIAALAADEDWLYVAATYARLGHSATVVWRLDESYGREALGEPFASLSFTGAIVEALMTLTAWAEEVWAATTTWSGNRPIRIRRIAPTGSTWTLDDGFGGTGFDRDYMPRALRGGGDRLVVAADPETTGLGGTKAILRMRSTTAGWSTLEESPTTDGDRYGLIAVTRSGATVARYRADTMETAVRRTSDYATFVDIAGPSASWNGLWVGGYDLAGTRYALLNSGAGYQVVAVTASSASVVYTSLAGEVSRGVGGWQ
ncbi:MAG: hypothetical protein QN178_14090, partial [Armatimonadota bacterium]|nr:hypothetical protein [Armatimonadota bacterium]